jgi:hypothetical protein
VLGTFFAAGLLFIAAGVLAGVAYALSGGEWLHWLALHLLFLGGISSTSAPLRAAGRRKRALAVGHDIWLAQLPIRLQQRWAVRVPAGQRPAAAVVPVPRQAHARRPSASR